MSVKFLTRRKLLFGTAGAGFFATLGLRPSDESGPSDEYFDSIRSALHLSGISTPTLVIDKDRLASNVDVLMSHLPNNMAYRVVAKSLPSIELINFVSNRAETHRVMTFNLEMLRELGNTSYEQLLGKPLPVSAAKTYLTSVSEGKRIDQIQWLIDSQKRLAEYAMLAKSLDQVLRINLEIDVGLHRGGFDLNQLELALTFVRDQPYLDFSGFMGYEPHVAALPEIFGWQENSLLEAWSIYGKAIDLAENRLGSSAVDKVTRNAAGSKTYQFYKNTSIANELSIGSALVKPSGFDHPLLEDYQPASFIATPVLKSTNVTKLPDGLGPLDEIYQAWNPNYRRAIFIYGGNWMADPVDPPGLRVNPIFGYSSNQQMMNAGEKLELDVDDFAFFRPRQSEAVFMHFGDIAVFQGGEITARWPVFPASA